MHSICLGHRVDLIRMQRDNHNHNGLPYSASDPDIRSEINNVCRFAATLKYLTDGALENINVAIGLKASTTPTMFMAKPTYYPTT